MPKLPTIRSRKPPEGWDEIEPTLTELAKKMREGAS
jgi:bud site selection protein 31